LTTTHTDSSLARFMTQQIVSDVTAAFQRAVKAQAADTKTSLNQRFDSAATRLREAERAMQEFYARNRTVPQYSPTSLERDRLNRELTLSQTLYSQVETEREAARQKEMEDTPAVVIVEPLPRELTRLSQQLAARTGGAFVGTLILVTLFVIVLELWHPSATLGTADRGLIRRALYHNRLLRWTIMHRVSPPERAPAG
jgi:uncharacterized protein involved in exopolysaccharide biosynthesis